MSVWDWVQDYRHEAVVRGDEERLWLTQAFHEAWDLRETDTDRAGAILEDARRLVAEFVAHYNEVRLHSAIGYVTPADKMAGRDREIFADRDRKLNAARERRRAAREASGPAV